MKKTLLFSLTFIISIALFSCASSEPISCILPSVTASSNSPAISGGSLQLNAKSIKNIMTDFKWTGPNNFESSLQNPIIPNLTSSMAGEYKVKAVKGICESTESSTIVEITSVPCNPSLNNTMTFEGSSSTKVFRNISASNSSGDFKINASGSEGDLIIEFANESIPTPGIYNINCSSSMLTNEVCVSLYIGINYVSPEEGKVYLTSLNGKFIVVFCNVLFQLSTLNLNATVKITQN